MIMFVMMLVIMGVCLCSYMFSVVMMILVRSVSSGWVSLVLGIEVSVEGMRFVVSFGLMVVYDGVVGLRVFCIRFVLRVSMVSGSEYVLMVWMLVLSVSDYVDVVLSFILLMVIRLCCGKVL